MSKETKSANKKTKRSLALRSCFSYSFERSKIIILIFSVYSLLCLIMGILLSLSQVDEAFFGFNEILSTVYSLLLKIDMIGLGLGLISAVWLFAKYTNYCSDNLIKSLPATDRQLFSADFITGLLSFLIPVSIGLGLQTLSGSLIESTMSHQGVFSTFGVSFGFILNYVFGYCIAVLCFALSKGVLESVITFVLLNFIPSIVSSFVAFFCSAVLGTYPVDEFANTLKLKSSYEVIASAISGTNDLTKISYLQMLYISLAVLAICIVVTALAYFAFIKLRSPEKSGSKIKSAISIFAVCAISFYCGFLILFFKRTGITLFNSLVIIPTMIIASFIVYFLANTIILKTIRIPLKKFIPYTCVIGVLAFIGIYYFTCGFGIADYIPVSENIESVTINYMDSTYQDTLKQKKNEMFENIKVMPKYDLDVTFPVKYTDKDSIESVIKYQNALLNEYLKHDMVETTLQQSELFKTSSTEDAERTRTVITYKLKNGKTVSRYYNYNGTYDTISKLSMLDVFGHSVKETQPRSLTYIEKEPDETVSHTIYVRPIASDNKVEIHADVSDKKLQKLVRAIMDDEKTFSDDDLLNNPNGDLCYIEIEPEEKDRDNPYFDAVFSSRTSSYRLFVKTNYKNVIAFIKNDLGGEEQMKGYSGSDVKQIFVGKFSDSSINIGYEYNPYQYMYMFYPGITYQFDYFRCTRYYNSQAITTAQDKANVDGNATNSKAIDYLLSHGRLLCNIDSTNEGYAVIMNSTILVPFNKGDVSEMRGAYSNTVLYLTAEEYAQFVNLSK